MPLKTPPNHPRLQELAEGRVPLGIGAETRIRKAILDKNVRVGRRCQLVNKEGVRDGGRNLPKGVSIREGILVVKKDAVVPDGTVV